MADAGKPDGESGLTRRKALIGAGAAVMVAGGAAGVILATGDDESATSGDNESGGYPRRTVARKGDLKPDQPVNFDYPREGQRSVLLDLGQEVPGGVGENASIVAYSSLCQHMGCPVGFDPAAKHFLCGCHQTRYDPAREGVVIQGVSQRPLPRIALELDGDDIVATGVDGLIYGFRSNLAQTA
jgi:arsenite oxidase small subunit